MTSPADNDSTKPSNFLRHVIESDLEQGHYSTRKWGGSPGDAAHHAAGMQDPAKVRTLWYLNHHPNEVAKAGLFPVSWCRMAGQGKVFYTSLGHREDLWSDDPTLKDRKNSVELSQQFQAHLLGGIKWALGLAEGSAVPNPEIK